MSITGNGEQDESPLNETHIPATDEILRTGVRQSYTRCPIALAIREHFRGLPEKGTYFGHQETYTVGVSPSRIRIGEMEYFCTPELRIMIIEYDMNEKDIPSGTLVLDGNNFTARYVPDGIEEVMHSYQIIVNFKSEKEIGEDQKNALENVIRDEIFDDLALKSVIDVQLNKIDE